VEFRKTVILQVDVIVLLKLYTVQKQNLGLQPFIALSAFVVQISVVYEVELAHDWLAISTMVFLTMCIAALISLVGVALFARNFYGNANEYPFGHSFALTIVGFVFFFVNGILLVVHTISIHRYLCSARANLRGRSQSPGFLGFLQDCCGVL